MNLSLSFPEDILPIQKTESFLTVIPPLVVAYRLLRGSYATSRDVDTKKLGNSGEKFFPDTRLHQTAPLTKEFLCEERQFMLTGKRKY